MKTNLIISIHPKYVDFIDKGEKIFEIRTRRLNVEEGARVWIYRTLPDACISSTATIEKIIEIAPRQAWKKFSKEMCVSKLDFENYTKNRKLIYLLELRRVQFLNTPLTLNRLRKEIPPFFPPQFFKKLDLNEQILKILMNELAVSKAYIE